MIPTTRAILDIDAVQHNLRIVRQHAPAAKVMAVIKANAYGHGLLRIAEVLKHKVDAVAVARTNEGIHLRNAGFHQSITVLEGFLGIDEFQQHIKHNLNAVIHSPEQIDILESHQGQEAISVWLKMDTGMNRLGFKDDYFRLAYQRLKQCEKVKLSGLMTHLANADDINDDTSSRQITTFKNATKGYPEPCSIANSAAILGWKASLTDWVRPGIMLYGCSPFPDKSAAQINLKPVMSLHSQLISIKSVAQGEKIGYGGSWRCDSKTQIAVVAIGYGDGYPRYAKSGTPVLVNAKRVPLVGRVSMDMITVDLQSQPQAKLGDPVILWGQDLAVEEIAQFADTIPYTLLCGITQRVPMIEKK